MISLDTETTGIDFFHGARPFFVTLCDEEGNQQFWEWPVDPLTRKPSIPEEDVDEIAEAVSPNETGHVVFQNAKFDVAALTTIRPEFGEFWDWGRTYDTLLAGHLLASNQPHDLTSMALIYLGINIQPFEIALKEAVNEARRIARAQFPDWRIASEGDSLMPSAKGTKWGYDMWLPRAIALEMGYEDNHPWLTVLREYSNTDSAVTMALWKVMEKTLNQRGLWKIYAERLKVLPVVFSMEQQGITVNKARAEVQRRNCLKESGALAEVCYEITRKRDFPLKLPKAGANNSLLEFLDILGVKKPTVDEERDSAFLRESGGSKRVLGYPTKTGKLSTKSASMLLYNSQFEVGSDGDKFTMAIVDKRKRDTAVSYIESYQRFWLPLRGYPDWARLYPSLNATGTDTLRFTSSNPNEQNVSKKEGFNLRYMFGPAPGREWWSLDAKNLELRIPAYESGEREMVELFDRPNDPPYFGSYHLLIFNILHPLEFQRHGAKCKDLYESTLYQWTKNGNFAVTYGAVEESGTADRAYHVKGAHAKIKARFTNLAQLNQKYISLAKKHGYVETIPDKTVDPSRGYPLLCSRTEYGDVKPTVPFNYHVQGTAMQWMSKAMTRCYPQLQKWNDLGKEKYHMIIQVHDELVFDFPRGGGREPWKVNLPKIRRIQKLMEQGGDDIGVPTPVSVEYHSDCWSKGKSL